MEQLGRCYCGALTYRLRGNARVAGQCHCRECQYISGGGPNYFLVWPKASFEWLSGQVASFSRKEGGVVREFCRECGTHMTTRPPFMTDLIVKVGTLDDPSKFRVQMAFWTSEKPEFHHIAEGVQTFESIPPLGR